MGKQIVIVGGGAAGFFGAIEHKSRFPENDVQIIEKGSQVLTKVRISGGGRCNVTHACFEPKELVKFYPRGGKELLGLFMRFGTKDTVQWFEERGIELKTESDNRMFPITDTSQTIIQCFHDAAWNKKIPIKTGVGMKSLFFEDGMWHINTDKGIIKADSVLLATGSVSKVWEMLEGLGHTIVPPVPSLFTFHIDDDCLKGLEGISLPKVKISVKGTKLVQTGALLITHWGLSAPAVLKLSAFGAKELFAMDYNFTIFINFFAENNAESLREVFEGIKAQYPTRQIAANPLGNIPQRLWRNLCDKAGLEKEITWANLKKASMIKLTETLTNCAFDVTGKSSFKEEFVTAGGVSLKEVDFRTMESKLHKGLFFAGEMLDIDAVTGGFNFQAAWSTSWLAAQSM